jgi:hypothetical protein
MTEHCVPFKLTIEGQEIDAYLTEKNWELVLEAINKNKKTGYERVANNDTYFAVHPQSGLYINHDFGDKVDMDYYDAANYYSDRTVAENNDRADKLIRQLRRFAVEHRKQSLDWHNDYMPKWSIVYNYEANTLECWDIYSNKEFGSVYFDSEENAGLAIDTFHDELVWYFTEYKDSL